MSQATSKFRLLTLSPILCSLSGYGANVDVIKAPLGGTVCVDDVEQALNRRKYKVVTITHVDTSTGVLSDAQAIAACVKRISPSTLVSFRS